MRLDDTMLLLQLTIILTTSHNQEEHNVTESLVETYIAVEASKGELVFT